MANDPAFRLTFAECTVRAKIVGQRGWLAERHETNPRVRYDIAEPKRLQRVYRCMIRRALPLELSVFWLEGSERDKACCLEAISALLDARKDDVRCYAMPARGWKKRIGKTALPAGIIWTALPDDWLDSG